jgi:cellulose synthase/poly-beta-1,6-N-acetylglucosamine synthase-like glycosyltransferase/transposase
MSDFPAPTRRILQRVIDGKLDKTEASKRLSVSRTTIYKWLKDYTDDPEGEKRTSKINRELLKIISSNPKFGPRRISRGLEKKGIKLSERSVWLILKKKNLHKRILRKDYSKKYKKTRKTKHQKIPGHIRLTNYSRKRMVEEVVLEKRRVDVVIKKYHVSRKTFAKWKKRYKEAQREGSNLLNALKDQNPKGAKHPRGVSEVKEDIILSLIVSNPQWSSHKIAKKIKTVGNHGVQKILEKHNLNKKSARYLYSKKHKTTKKISYIPALTRVRIVWEQFIETLASIPPPAIIFDYVKRASVLVSVFVAVIFAGSILIRTLLTVSYQHTRIGIYFAFLALFMGSIFFAYSLKYYLTLAIVLSFSQGEGEVGIRGSINGRKRGLLSWLLGEGNGLNKNNKPKPVGLEPDLSHISLKKRPKISIHIPFYNEKNVVRRAIESTIAFDYPNFEVILCNDSTDSTTQIIDDYIRRHCTNIKIKKGDGWRLTSAKVKRGVYLKHLHRTSRSGFKGGALQEALKHTDKQAEFICVFDADFVPYPDTLDLFLKYFKVQNNMSENYKKSDVAAVQGYQWHVLNKSENWITRGVRSEYAGSYVIERSGVEIYGGLKQIAGSVYMIRRDILGKIGWQTSITEDFELTLRLYEKGYKVVYTPYVQAPAECVSSMKHLIRQRMRWAEGHSNNVKKMFGKLMFSKKLNFTEKFEFLYLTPYYLQAFFFLVGTISWIMAETLFPARLPFWTSLWGWSLVLTNFISLPLVNAVGLFLEESEEKDYTGLLSFVTLSYILVPFQAYAALKGFLEKEEGPWFRTPKTGKITDVFTRLQFYRFIAGILPGAKPSFAQDKAVEPAFNPYLALSTANNQFNSFNLKRKRNRWLSKFTLSILLAITVSLYSATRGVPEVMASNWTNLYLRSDVQACTGTNALTTGTGLSNSSSEISETNPGPYYWYSDSLPTGSSNATVVAGTWTMYTQGTFYTGGGGSNVKFNGIVDLVDSGDCSSNPISLGTATSGPISGQGDFPYSLAITVVGQTITSANPKRIRLTLSHSSSNKGAYMDVNFNNSSPYDSNLQPSTLTVPENALAIIFLTPLIPYFVHLWMKKRSLKIGSLCN